MPLRRTPAPKRLAKWPVSSLLIDHLLWKKGEASSRGQFGTPVGTALAGCGQRSWGRAQGHVGFLAAGPFQKERMASTEAGAGELAECGEKLRHLGIFST